MVGKTGSVMQQTDTSNQNSFLFGGETKMRSSKFYSVLLLALIAAFALGACAPASTPAATTAPAAQPTTAAAATVPAGQPTKAPATQATSATVAVSNPPTTAAMVDAIDLQGKKVQVTYWHNRPQ